MGCTKWGTECLSWETLSLVSLLVHNHTPHQPTSPPLAHTHLTLHSATTVRSFTTLTTVGYGDFTPQTDWELIWTCCVMFVGTCTFGYIIGNGMHGVRSTALALRPSSPHAVTSIITNENATTALIKQRSTAINEYMKGRVVWSTHRYSAFPSLLPSL